MLPADAAIPCIRTDQLTELFAGNLTQVLHRHAAGLQKHNGSRLCQGHFR